MTLRTLLTSLALSLMTFQPAAAQLPPAGQATKPEPVSKEKKEEEEKARKELERKALALLDDTLQGAQALKLAENRSLVQAEAADLLWKHEEKRARALFREALLGVAGAMGGEDVSRRDNSYWTLVQVRHQMLRTVAARDPQLALDLLRETRPAPAENSEADPQMSQQELALEQSILAAAAENDPKAALRMAEESLSRGVSYGVLSALERLREKDPESATRLAGAIVRKLRGESLSEGREGAFVALSLLRGALPPAELGYNARPGAEKPKPLVVEESALRELAELVSDAALRDANGRRGLLMQVQPLLPELEKRAPGRAAQLRAKIAALEKTLDPHEKAWMQFNSVIQAGSADAILEAAAKAPAEMRPNFYTIAAMKLAQSGETERARQVVADNLRGAERDNMLAHLDRAALAAAVGKGKLDEAKALISRVESKERRAALLAQLASAFTSKGERKAALALLEEARGLVERQPDDQKGIEALLEVARGYAAVEPAKTFELLDPLIDQANDMLAAAALLEKFGSGQGAFRKGEMLLFVGLSNAGGMYAHYVRALSQLARVDFERTGAAADRFRREEARLLARLIIAQSVLSDRPAPAAGAHGEGFFFGGGAILVGN
jgi:hypothetical protein